MFQFIKNLLGGGIPKRLKYLSVMFENGDFEGCATFLKKYKISTDDKTLKTINPHFEDYFGKFRVENIYAERYLPEKFDVNKNQYLPASYTLPQGLYGGWRRFSDDRTYNGKKFITPSFLNSLRIDLDYEFEFQFFRSINLHETEKWNWKKKITVIKNNPKTTIHLFTKIYKPLIDDNFRLINIPNVDIIYIWLDKYSFFHNVDWFENQNKKDLNKFPKKQLVFGCDKKEDFAIFVKNLQNLGYKASLVDGFEESHDFFNKIFKRIEE